MSSKTKIYINARFLTQPITGVQRYGRELVRAIDQLVDKNDPAVRGLEISLLTPCEDVDFFPLKHLPIRKYGRFSGHIWEQLELPSIARNGILFCPGNTAPVQGLYGKTPLVTVVHDLSYRYFPSAYSRAFRAAYAVLTPAIMSRSTGIITVSHAEKAAILKHYPRAEERLFAIQNGGLPDELLQTLPKNQPRKATEPYFVYVGALNRRKNPQGILEAFGKIASENQARLMLIGSSGKSFQGSQFSLPENAAGQVDFAGQINDTHRLIDLYHGATALIFPSFYEASPLPPIEAMACGCPVLASTIPSLQERCGDAALYCDPYSVDDIAEKMQDLLTNTGLRNELREKGVVRARQFTWQRCARETLKIIREVAGK